MTKVSESLSKCLFSTLCDNGPSCRCETDQQLFSRFLYTVTRGAIIGDGDHNEVPFIIASATPCEGRFGLFLAQIAPSLQNKKRALHANLRSDLDKLRRQTRKVHGIFKYQAGTQRRFSPKCFKRCFRLSGVLLKLCRLILGCAIKFLSVRSV